MVMIVGHRGARDIWPENSLLGFRETSRLAIEAVEFDVHLTRDGGIVVIHDPSLERTTHGEGPVGALTLARAARTILRNTDGECVPTLEQVLDVYQESRFELHIEIKTDMGGNPYPGLEQRVVDIVRRRGLASRAVMTCFVPGILDRLYALAPDIARLASLDRRSAEMLGGIEATLDRLLANDGTMIAVEKSLLAHSRDICLATAGPARLAAWIANSREELAYWLAQKIRAVTTDRPDLACEVRAALAASGE